MNKKRKKIKNIVKRKKSKRKTIPRKIRGNIGTKRPKEKKRKTRTGKRTRTTATRIRTPRKMKTCSV